MTIKSWLTDMDGVLVHESYALPGAADFLAELREQQLPFQVLTNNSIFTPRDLAARLRAAGVEVAESDLWTSALATARFLADQLPECCQAALCVAGLTAALYAVGYSVTDIGPDYVGLGGARSDSSAPLAPAVRLIEGGARFIATNPDVTGPSREGPRPAAGSVAALITAATGREPYFVGKPNPVMIRTAMNRINAHSESTAMIGDRMDTDVVAGMEAGLRTYLVLSGSTEAHEVERFPFRPNEIHEDISSIVRRLTSAPETEEQAQE